MPERESQKGQHKVQIALLSSISIRPTKIWGLDKEIHP
jgi:hypothetical protein